MDLNKLTETVIGAAIEVHKAIGPGLLEKVYQECLAHELSLRSINVRKEIPLPIIYKDLRLQEAFKMDMLVEECLVLELKAVDKLSPIYTAQLLSYLKMSSLKLGLLINFNVPRLTDGLKRIINDF